MLASFIYMYIDIPMTGTLQVLIIFGKQDTVGIHNIQVLYLGPPFSNFNFEKTLWPTFWYDVIWQNDVTRIWAYKCRRICDGSQFCRSEELTQTSCLPFLEEYFNIESPLCPNTVISENTYNIFLWSGFSQLLSFYDLFSLLVST